MANRHRARLANYIPHMLSILIEQAIDIDWQRDNPAKGIAKIKTGNGHQPWPEWAIASYRKEAQGTALLSFELALGTKQGASDHTRMEWAPIESDGVWVTQGKTKARLWIPFTSALKAAQETTKHTSLSHILNDEFGRKLNYDQIQKLVMAVRKATGLTEFTLHGLQNSAASE